MNWCVRHFFMVADPAKIHIARVVTQVCVRPHTQRPQMRVQPLSEDLIWRNTMSTYLENAPSKTGNPSGGGRGNNPPRGK